MQVDDTIEDLSLEFTKIRDNLQIYMPRCANYFSNSFYSHYHRLLGRLHMLQTYKKGSLDSRASLNVQIAI